MRLDDAVKRAGGNESVQRLKAFFLGSCFASIAGDADNGKEDDIKEWTLLYYNPGSRTVVDCFVSEKFVTVGEETPALSEVRQLDVKFVRVDVKAALRTARERMQKKTINTLISLHGKEIGGKPHVVWTIGLITPDISATSIDIDAESGEVLKEETTSLLRRM